MHDMTIVIGIVTTKLNTHIIKRANERVTIRHDTLVESVGRWEDRNRHAEMELIIKGRFRNRTRGFAIKHVGKRYNKHAKDAMPKNERHQKHIEWRLKDTIIGREEYFIRNKNSSSRNNLTPT
jgi:hypothetical protein